MSPPSSLTPPSNSFETCHNSNLNPNDSSSNQNSNSSPSNVSPPFTNNSTAFRREEVVSDNSCLFTCINILLFGNRQSIASLRHLTATSIAADPDTFNDVTLDRPVDEYIRWVQLPSSWGGYIELIAIAKKVGVEIVVFDIPTGRADTYGMDAGYKRRIYMTYDGAHYDAIYAEDGETKRLQYQFNPEDNQAYARCQEVVHEIRKSSRFTDTSNFVLKCLVCENFFKGMSEANAHAAATGHRNFDEVARK